MTNEPDFRELVGDEGDRAELDRLRRVHELLVAAGPPAELSPRVANPPEIEESKVLEFKRRRPATLIMTGIAAVAAAFVIGYAIGGHHSNFSSSGQPIRMHGVGQTIAARGSIEIGSHDSGGNYPVQMTVDGLPKLPKGGWYELLLSKNGRPTLPCGDFAVDDRPTTIRMSVPYDFSDLRAHKAFDGWVVVAHRPQQKAAPIVMST